MAEEKKRCFGVHKPRNRGGAQAAPQKNYEAGVAAGLDPLMTPEPSIGSLVRSYLLAALGMHKNYGGE
ncbi:hypothetical protein SE963_02205 [Escherichia coli]|nr:hypothetical protein [Escherichia coli]